MGRRIRLGRVFGIEVAVDWSWVFTLVLAAWTLATLADHALPTVPGGAVTLLGGAAAIGLFASLAVHEIAHGLAARACGVPVHRLTLFLFGGITDVERAPASPRTEVIAALIAPLSNAILGGVLVSAAALLGGATNAIGMLVGWLGAANLAIAALNLLPGFPLDGGRLVRAAFWRATGDVDRATRWSAWAGQVLGWLIVLGGVLLAFASHGPGVAAAMWVTFIGWFLASAAAQAYAEVHAQTALAGVTVSRLMRRQVEAGAADMTDVAMPSDDAATTLRMLTDRAVDRVPVVEGGRVVGLVDRADIERWIETHASSSSLGGLEEH